MAEEDPRLQRRLAHAKERASRTSLKIRPVEMEGLDPGERGFTFRASKGTRDVVGTASYSRPEKAISVHGIGPDYSKKIVGSIAGGNPDIDPSMMRGLLREVKKRFPAAEEVRGFRVTGAHAKAFEKHGDASSIQRISLRGVAKAASRGVKGLGVIGQAANAVEHWRAANVVNQEANKDAPFSTRFAAYAERVLGVEPGITKRNPLPSEVKAAHSL